MDCHASLAMTNARHYEAARISRHCETEETSRHCKELNKITSLRGA